MRWPLAGRGAELAFVAEALAGGSAGGVVVTGPAGVGKTRLAAVAAERADAEVAWVRATRSAASLPLGAFAPLLPAAALPGGAERLAHARDALAQRAAGRRLVLCVDDGHLLDAASAALLHQLVAAGEAFALVTVREGAPVPDAVRALWKDELCAVLELGPLARDDVEALLAAGLGAPVAGATSSAIWELTRGNALFVRELARHGVDRGLLAEDGGVWRWRGPLEAGTRLAQLVDLRTGDVGAAAREQLESLAVAAPLELDLLGDVAELERAELVVRRTEGRRRFADLAHPLHGEAVRARLTPSRLDAIRTRLADAVAASGARRDGDLLRVATWRLDAGAAGDAALLTRAAGAALAVPDPALAERLARAAVHADPAFDARLALARALAATGDGAGAEQLLAELAPAAPDDAARAEIAVARARNLFWTLDRAADADAVLQAAAAELREPAVRHELAAQRVRLTAADGRPAAALAGAGPLLGDVAVDERVRITVALGAVEALLSSGRSAEAVALAGEWLAAARRRHDDLPHAEAVLLGMRALALRLAGRLAEATAESAHAYELLRGGGRRPRPPSRRTCSASPGWRAAASRRRLRLCRESAALLRDGDAVGMLAFALAGVAQAAAQAGDAGAARAAVAELDRTPLGHKGFAAELGLAHAWSAAASGELSRARALARDAAAAARARGQDAYAVWALHALCRLGDPAAAAPGLAELAERVDGPYAGLAAAHAATLVAGDGAALLATAERFAEHDALLVAVEAAEAAAARHREAGRRSSARAAAARAGLWLTHCEGARPPTLAGAPEAAGLTRREREIALLAAGGSSSREIAARLVVSVRTVDNHLQNAYRKLGVTRRQDLPQALE